MFFFIFTLYFIQGFLFPGISHADLPVSPGLGIPFSEISAEYVSLPGSFIVPVKTDSQRLFVLDRFKNTYKPYGPDEFNPTITQDLFKLDTRRFTRWMDTDDFLDAKSRYYANLKFNPKTQFHELPYRRLHGWFTLNHPPVKNAEIPLGEYVKVFSPHSPAPEKSAFFDVDFQKSLDHESNTELTFGNRTRTLFNGDSIAEKVRLVNEAQKYVFGAVMAYVCDASAEPLTDALIAKASSGVPVTLMMERFYMGILYHHCVRKLRNGGVDVVLVSDKWKPSRFLSFFHDKFWVRDGEEVIVGGQNIIDFENESTGFNHLNRDTDLLVSGPMASDFAESFLELWAEYSTAWNRSIESFRSEIQESKKLQRELLLRGSDSYAEHLNGPTRRRQGACRAIIQNAGARNRSFADVLKRHFERSEHSIVMTSPEIESLGETGFFKPIEEATKKRNVRVELISNGVDGGTGEFTATIHRAMVNASLRGKRFKRNFWNWVLRWEPRKIAEKRREILLELQENVGLRAWTHFNYMHAKQIYIDRTVTSISSLNLDRASLERNHEAGAICMDDGLSEKMETQLVLDLVNSVPITDD